MSRVSEILAVSQTLSLTGFEEASRFGRVHADLGDLLVALVQDDGAGGQVLRGVGLTLHATRSAIAETQSQELRRLGIELPAAERGPQRPERLSGIDWSPAAERIFRESSAADSYSLSILRTLLHEPSGLIPAVLEHADVDMTALERLVASHDSLAPVQTRPSHHLHGSGNAFAASQITEVWNWISQPDSLSSWSHLESMLPDPDDAHSWSAMTVTTGSDGRSLGMKPEFIRRGVTRSAMTAPASVTWELSFPDAPRANTQRVTLELIPAAGGTRISVDVTWIPGPGKRPMFSRIVAPLMRPVVRRVVRFQARSIGRSVASHFADM